MKRKRASPPPDHAAAEAAAWGWHIVVWKLGELSEEVPESAAEIRKFVEGLQYICNGLSKEAAPDETSAQLFNRLAKGFSRGQALERIKDTPHSLAKQWARQAWTETGSTFPSRIAFAEYAAEHIEATFGIPVEPQKTIVDRWINDL